MTRSVILGYSRNSGRSSAWWFQSRSRSAPLVTVAPALNFSPPSSTVTSGFACRLYNHAGFVGAPLFEAAILSACPSDAAPAARRAATRTLKRPGGRGAVREFIDIILARNGQSGVVTHRPG